MRRYIIYSLKTTSVTPMSHWDAATSRVQTVTTTMDSSPSHVAMTRTTKPRDKYGVQPTSASWHWTTVCPLPSQPASCGSQLRPMFFLFSIYQHSSNKDCSYISPLACLSPSSTSNTSRDISAIIKLRDISHDQPI